MDHTLSSTALVGYLYSPLPAGWSLNFSIWHRRILMIWLLLTSPFSCPPLPSISTTTLVSFNMLTLRLSQLLPPFRLCSLSFFSTWPIFTSLPRHSSYVPSALKPFLNLQVIYLLIPLFPILPHYFLVTVIALVTLLCNYWCHGCLSELSECRT